MSSSLTPTICLKPRRTAWVARMCVGHLGVAGVDRSLLPFAGEGVAEGDG